MASTRLFFARSRSSLAGSVVRPALPLAARSLHHLPPLQRPSLTSSSSSKGASPSPAEPEALPPRRSLLYVPGSSDKMIKGVQASRADCLIFDLEDSVAPHRKGTARESVRYGLELSPRPGRELAVRINAPSEGIGPGSLAPDDLDVVLSCRSLDTILIPKVESAEDALFVLERARSIRPEDVGPLRLILSVESAGSLVRMPSILAEIARSVEGGLEGSGVGALLFASEDFCASTGITRTRSRIEMLFPRSQMVVTAKAHGLSAIDMVCIDYKDTAYLEEESLEGSRLGMDGKQAIHPAQVDVIQRAFSPSEADILRAARIEHAYRASLKANAGAVGLQDGTQGSMIMIDAPMLKQAETTLNKARAAGLEIPDVEALERASAAAASKTNGNKG